MTPELPTFPLPQNRTKTSITKQCEAFVDPHDVCRRHYFVPISVLFPALMLFRKWRSSGSWLADIWVSEELCQVWQNDTLTVSTLVLTAPHPCGSISVWNRVNGSGKFVSIFNFLLP